MADVEDLTGVGSSGTQGVLAECLGVAAGGTLLLLAVDPAPSSDQARHWPW